jgi:YVTN family beta-propeller protein
MRSLKRAVLHSALLSTLIILPMAAMTLGTRPAQAAPFVYVTNSGSDTVSIVDRASNTVVKTITVGPNPRGVAITPNGKFMYVANWGSNTVSVIATANSTVVKTIIVGNSPYGVAITPNGKFAYVANAASNTVSVIATASNTVVATIPVGCSPARAAITPNGQFVYVTTSGCSLADPGTVAVIATASNTVVTTIPVDGAIGVAIAPNGTFAYVGGDAGVSVIPTASNSVVFIIPIPSGGELPDVAITPGSRIAYVVSRTARSVSVIYTPTNKVIQKIGMDDPTGAAITQNGNYLYVANQGSNKVLIVATADDSVSQVGGVFKGPWDVAVALSGLGQLRGLSQHPARSGAQGNGGRVRLPR